MHSQQASEKRQADGIHVKGVDVCRHFVHCDECPPQALDGRVARHACGHYGVAGAGLEFVEVAMEKSACDMDVYQLTAWLYVPGRRQQIRRPG